MPIETYQLQTGTYSSSSTPFLSVHTLQCLLKYQNNDRSKASEIAKHDFYADDVLTGGVEEN